jgi:hypothetical protein
MGTLHELRSQIDQGKMAVLSFKEDDENIEVSIKVVQGQYTRIFSYLDRLNPFTQQRTEPYSSWGHLLADLTDFEKKSNQWRIE